MGVKLHLMLGVVLTSFVLVSQCARAETNVTNVQSVEKNDRNLNLIEKIPKTDIEQKYVHSNTPDNYSSNYVNKSEASEESRESESAPNVITKETKKENVVDPDRSEKSREDNSRSINIEKYVSPEFQNNVYTIPNFPDTEKHSDHMDFRSSTERDFDFELTTPKTTYFDKKFQEAVQKLEQEFEETHNENDDEHEHEDHDDIRGNDNIHENEDSEEELERNIEKTKLMPNSTMDYKEMKNIIMKNNTGKKSAHNDIIFEKIKKVNYVINFNDTQTYSYDSTETTPRTELTTRKNLVLTKPPNNNKNNSDILNNKIETETIKAINMVTTEAPLDKKIIDDVSSKENIQENQIIPVNTTRAPEKHVTTTTTTINPVVEETTEYLISTTTEGTTEMSTAGITATELTTNAVSETENELTSTLESTTSESTEQTSIALDTTTETSTVTVEPTTQEPATESTTEQQTTTDETTPVTASFTTIPVVDTTTEQTTVIPSTMKEELTTTPESETVTVTIVPLTEPPQISRSTTSNLENTRQLDTTESEMIEASLGTETSIGTPSPEESNKAKIAAITISTIGAVCLIILAGLLYIMRKRQKRFNYKQRCRPVSLDDYSVDNVSVYNSVRRKGLDRQSKRSYGNPTFDDPAGPTHPLNFPALAKFASNFEDIKAEFEEIPQITARTSELPEGCEPKNRYANVIPLPETRVFLQFIDGYPNSDYINANYVTGPKDTKGFFIACQAPMQNTVDDFWRMVWEQQAKVILMVTHLFENGVEKCTDYLPPSEVLDCHRLFGDFQVTLKKRDVKEKYIISSLQLKNMVSNSWREVTHFWYLGWPDKGVPFEANSLIAFLIEARSYMKTSTLDKNATFDGGPPMNEVNPVVVHCSPGTGRTGVVIACDIAIREFEQTRLVDIPKIVYRIRRDRANAIQTKEQYIFIYKVLSLYATKLTGGALDSI